MGDKKLLTGEALTARARELGVSVEGDGFINIPGVGTVCNRASDPEIQRRVAAAEESLRNHQVLRNSTIVAIGTIIAAVATLIPFWRNNAMNSPESALEWIKIIAVLGALGLAFYGLNRIFGRLKAQQQGFGPNTLKAMGIVIFIPTLLVLSLLTNFQTETLAALLGTIAGYVLSGSEKE